MTGVVERLRDLEAQATPAPWKSCPNPAYVTALSLQGLQLARILTEDPESYETLPVEANSRLIAEARNALPLLLAVVEAARVQADERERETFAVLHEALARLDRGATP